MNTQTETRFFLEKKQSATDLPLIDTQTQSLANYWFIALVSIAIILSQVATNFVGTANPIELGLVGLYQIFGPLLLFLLLFRYGAKQPLKTLYRRFSVRDLGVMLLFTVINLAYGQLASSFIPSVANKGIIASTGHGSLANKILHFTTNSILNVPALMIEELFGIILFLAVAAMIKKYSHLGRNASMWIALVISMFMFGLMHFYVYDWHLAQMFFIIGVSRLITTGLYIRTKSIWPAFFAHWLTDTFIAFVTTFTLWQ